MKKALLFVSFAIAAILLSSANNPVFARTPLPPEVTMSLDSNGVEFLNLMRERNIQGDLIADKLKDLFEYGTTITSATISHRPRVVGSRYRRYRIIVLGHGGIGGAELIVTRNGPVIPNVKPTFTTEIRVLR